MKSNLEWEVRIFKLLSIVVILFGLLTLKCALGLGGGETVFMRVEIPEMCGYLISSLLILKTELCLWYIFRVKEIKVKAFRIGK